MFSRKCSFCRARWMPRLLVVLKCILCMRYCHGSFGDVCGCFHRVSVKNVLYSFPKCGAIVQILAAEPTSIL